MLSETGIPVSESVLGLIFLSADDGGPLTWVHSLASAVHPGAYTSSMLGVGRFRVAPMSLIGPCSHR